MRTSRCLRMFAAGAIAGAVALLGSWSVRDAHAQEGGAAKCKPVINLKCSTTTAGDSSTTTMCSIEVRTPNCSSPCKFRVRIRCFVDGTALPMITFLQDTVPAESGVGGNEPFKRDVNFNLAAGTRCAIHVSVSCDDGADSKSDNAPQPQPK